MRNRRQFLAGTALAVVMTAGPAISGLAQTAPKEPGPAAKMEAGNVAGSLPDAEANALMARAAARYYNSSQAGLEGFECSVHPDWRGIFLKANPGQAIAADDPRVVQLQSVRIVLHVRMKGETSIAWKVPDDTNSADKENAEMLGRMRLATEQTLKGFMQFWIPFVDGSAVPASAAGLKVGKTEKGYEAHGEEGSTSISEIFSSDLILEHFNVKMNNTSVQFVPSYKTTGKELLLANGFRAKILPAGAEAGQEQNILASVEYGTVGGFPIPSRLEMEVAGTGIFNTTLDECRVSTAEK